MLPVPMPLNQCRLAVIQRIDELNAQQQPRTHTRLVSYQEDAPKVEKEFTTHARIITTGSRAALLFVLQRARKTVEKLRKLEAQMPGIWAQHVTDTGEQVPSISCNAVELSRKLGTCEKSIRTYVQQWLASGFVLKKKFHGRKANFELWINPVYLWKTEVETVQKPISEHTSSTHIGHILGTNEKNLPPKSFLNPHETQKLQLTNVDKLHSDEIRKPSSGSGGLQQGGEPAPTALKAQGQAKQTATETNGAGGAPRPASSLDDAKMEGYVTALAIYSHTLLWPEESYSLEKTKVAIRTGVYNNFIDQMTSGQWEQFHDQCMRRIELVRDYVMRHPTGYRPQAPYSLVTQGKGWFDWENEKGFRGTESWFAADQRRKYERKVKDALDLAVREITTRHKLERHKNPSRMKASKRVRQTSLLELYRYHNHRLHRLGGPDTINRLNAKVGAFIR